MTGDALTRSRAEECVSDLALDRLLAGELVGAEAAIRDHLSTCAACTRRYAELRDDRERFPAEVQIEAAARRTSRAIGRRRAAVRAGAAVSVAAVAAIAAVVWLRAAPDGGVRVKGGELGLQLVARHHDGRVERVLPGAELAPGDGVRFEVSTARAGYLGIVGIDAARAVTPYLPRTGSLVAIHPGTSQLLDGSIVLDDTMGTERIVAIVCEHAMSVLDVVAAATRAVEVAGGDPQQLGPLGLDCAQTSFVIHKVAHE